MNTAPSTTGQEIGFVASAKGYLLSIEGLPSVTVNSIIVNEAGKRALVTALREDRIEAVTLDHMAVEPGDRFTKTRNDTLYSFGDHLTGRVINALGDPLDGKESFPSPNTALKLNVVADGVSHRDQIGDQFITGIPLVDTLLPLGKGQRQLLYGPIRSGKTQFIKELIINQQGQNIICIYAAIGKPATGIRQMASELFAAGTAKYTIIVAASSEDATPLITIAPSVAMSLAEYFMRQHKDVLLVLDDLGTHAKYVREVSLLEGHLPGRESYPGDIFYQHAHLMERAGNFYKSGSITLLPVLETDIESYSDLISTNVMASTDGHFSFSAALRAAGYFPSISCGESVTRVGRHTQSLVQKQLSTRSLTLLADFTEQEEYARFGTQISARAQEILRRGAVLREILKQPRELSRIALAAQVAFIGLAFTSFFDERDAAFVRKNRQALVAAFSENPRLEDIRKRALSDNTLDTFLKELETKKALIEEVCHS